VAHQALQVQVVLVVVQAQADQVVLPVQVVLQAMLPVLKDHKVQVVQVDQAELVVHLVLLVQVGQVVPVEVVVQVDQAELLVQVVQVVVVVLQVT